MKLKINDVEHKLLDPDQLTNQEIMAIEKETNSPIAEWQNMSMGVITGMAWATLRRDRPELKFKDVVFTMSDVIMDDEDEEETPVVGPGKPKPRKKTDS